MTKRKLWSLWNARLDAFPHERKGQALSNACLDLIKTCNPEIQIQKRIILESLRYFHAYKDCFYVDAKIPVFWEALEAEGFFDEEN